MAVNLSAISGATTTATSLSNLLLVTPNSNKGIQPQNVNVNVPYTPYNPNNGTNSQQPPAILFNYEGENTVTLESDITDHYVEDNTSVADQISLRPELITTSGFVGELNDVVPPLLSPLKFIADKLFTISAYVPVISETALIVYNEAFLAYQIAKNLVTTAVSAWSALAGDTTQTVNGLIVPRNMTQQQKYFIQFYTYWQQRTLFTVQTPWAIFPNCAIKSLRAIQDPETRVITDFEVTFKVMRFAKTITKTNLATGYQGRATAQASGLVNNGVSTPVSAGELTDESLVTGAFA